MTQLESLNYAAKQRLEANPEIAHRGLFLVKPMSRSHAILSPEPTGARRSLGLIALGAAAVVSPLLWVLHELMVSSH